MSELAPQVADVPMCPRHLAHRAVRTCTRCGQFVCGSCLPDGEVCTDCRNTLLAGVPSSAGRARWTARFLIFNAIAEGISVLGSLASAGGSTDSPSILAGVLTGLGGLGVLITYVGAVITFCRWEHLAFKQANALGVNTGVTPGFAVGAWFIPFVNLWRPFRILRDLLNGLAGPGADRAANMGMWWTLWVVSNVFSNVDARMELEGGSAVAVSAVSSVLSIGAAFLAVGVVRRVQGAVEARRGEAGP